MYMYETSHFATSHDKMADSSEMLATLCFALQEAKNSLQGMPIPCT